MGRIGPVIMSVAGDSFIQGARILAVLWEGATTSGDTTSLTERDTGALIWAGRTDSTQTYQGANFGEAGVHCPSGFRLQSISAGRVLVYLRES